MSLQKRRSWKMIRPAAVCSLLTISQMTLWRWVKAGTFPQPVRLTERTVLFRRVDVARWVDERADAS